MGTDKIKIYIPAVLLTLLGFLIAYQFVDPAPPSSLTFSAGQKGGAYYANAERYRDYLEQRGVTVNILESAGSLENVDRLTKGSADIAFVQSGMIQGRGQSLQSLGSMYYEPLWVFLRNNLDVKLLSDLKGKRIAVGLPGSGTRALSQRLLKDNGVDENSASLLPLGAPEAAKALRDNELDAVFIVSAASNKTVQMLQQSNVHLMNILRAEAYTRRINSLSAVKLPQGTLNFEQNIPGEDKHLLASTATLIANENLHPALQGLMMQAAMEIHNDGSLFAAAGTFPTAKYTGMQISDEAERFYKSGPSFLQRFLPFWAATMVDRLKVMLLPFIALLLPLFKVMPPLYRWRIRSRIYRWYEELGRIDMALADGFSDSLMDELNRIEAEIRKVNVPLSYAEELYELRTHLALIRDSASRSEG